MTHTHTITHYVSVRLSVSVSLFGALLNVAGCHSSNTMAVTKGATQDRRSGKVRRKKLPLWKRAAVRTKRLVVNSAVWLLRNAVEPVVELALDKVDHTTSFLLAPFTAPSRMHKQMRMLDTRLQTMNAKVAALRRLDAAREQEVQALKAALRKQRAGPRVTAEGKGKGKGKDKAAAKAHANGKAKSALITKPTTQHAAAPPSSSEFQQFHKMVSYVTALGVPNSCPFCLRTLLPGFFLPDQRRHP